MGQLPQKNEAPLAVGRPRADAADREVRHLPLQEVVLLLTWLLLLLLWILLLRTILLPLLLLLLLWKFGLCLHCTCLRLRQLLLLRWRSSWRWRRARTRRGRKRKVFQPREGSGEESSKEVGKVQVKSCRFSERNYRRRRGWLSFGTLRIWWLLEWRSLWWLLFRGKCHSYCCQAKLRVSLWRRRILWRLLWRELPWFILFWVFLFCVWVKWEEYNWLAEVFASTFETITKHRTTNKESF